MAIITFMSDFGTEDHYVAAVKGKILSKDATQQVVDISHTIRPYDISHAAVVLKSVFREFPAGSVHLVSVDSVREHSNGIALEVEGHFFVGYDCGLFSMISDIKPTDMVSIDLQGSTFPIKDILADIAIALASGQSLTQQGTSLPNMVELFARQLKVTKREIVGNVVNVDHYGNLLTNIRKDEFEKMLELNGNGTRYVVSFGRESFNQMHSHYTDVESGDCFVFFNSIGSLQIGINKGNAAQLLGLSVDVPVHIEFITN